MSNYIGYKLEDNIKRKSNNINSGKEDNLPQTMMRTKEYGGSGPSAAAREAKKYKQMSKQNPVKVYTKEEIAEYLAKK